MSRIHRVILLLSALTGAFLLVGGGLVIANGHPIQVTRTEYTGSWGLLPSLIGLLVLGITAVVAWDEWR